MLKLLGSRKLVPALLGLNVVALAAVIALGITGSLSDVVATVVSAGMAIGGAILIASQQRALDKEREIESNIAKDKVNALETSIRLIVDVFDSQKTSGKNPKPIELLRKFLDTRKEIFIWANQDTLVSFNSLIRVIKQPTHEDNEGEILVKAAAMVKYIAAVRKEIGHQDNDSMILDVSEAIFDEEMHEKMKKHLSNERKGSLA